MHNLRDIILIILKQQGISHYRFAKDMKAMYDVGETTIFDWLRGGRNVGCNVIEAVMDYLNLEIKSKGDCK